MINYSSKADSMYICINDPESVEYSKTLEANDFMLIDLDTDDDIIGIEILYISQVIPIECLKDFMALPFKMIWNHLRNIFTGGI